MRWAIALLLASAPAGADALSVPSGQRVEFVELIKDAAGNAEVTWRFRFLAPQIARDGGSVPADSAAADIDALCASFVVPHLAEAGQVPDQVIISLSDRITEFGIATPDATQFFEAYRIDGQNCIWEGF